MVEGEVVEEQDGAAEEGEPKELVPHVHQQAPVVVSGQGKGREVDNESDDTENNDDGFEEGKTSFCTRIGDVVECVACIPGEQYHLVPIRKKRGPCSGVWANDSIETEEQHEVKMAGQPSKIFHNRDLVHLEVDGDRKGKPNRWEEEEEK